jgi:hypothetical protein
VFRIALSLAGLRDLGGCRRVDLVTLDEMVDARLRRYGRGATAEQAGQGRGREPGPGTLAGDEPKPLVESGLVSDNLPD